MFKLLKAKKDKYEPIVREVTYIGEANTINCVYVVQQNIEEGIKNYCISLAKEDFRKINFELRHLKSSDIYLYLKSRLLIEPFIENDLEKVLGICKNKLPKLDIKEYTVFMT